MPQENANTASPFAKGREQDVGRRPRSAAPGSLFLRNMFAALRHRNFRLFFGGQFVSLIGTWMQSTAQALLVYQLTGSKLLLGLVTAAGSMPLLLFSTWGGSVADRHAKRKIVLCTQSSLMLFALILAALVWTGRVHIWHILMLATLAGCAMAFDMPARQAFMVEMTSREDLMNAISLNSSLVNGARVIGPSIAGFLMAQVGVAVCFFLNGLSYAAIIIGLCLMRLPRFVPPQQTNSAWAHAVEGFAYVWRHRRMRHILLLFAIVGMFGWSYLVLMPALATDMLQVGEAQYGMLFSANAFGAVLGGLTVASIGKRVRPRVLVLGGLWVFSAMVLLLAFAHNYYVALVFLAIGGWGMLLFFATTNTLLQTSATDEMRGRVMGVWALVFGGMTPMCGIQSGVVSQWLGVRWALSIGAIVCAVSAFVVWRRMRQTQAPSQPVRA